MVRKIDKKKWIILSPKLSFQFTYHICETYTIKNKCNFVLFYWPHRWEKEVVS